MCMDHPRVAPGLLLLAALIAYALVFYHDVLFQQRVVVFRDQYTILLAIDHVVRQLSRFDWPPLWTPYQGLGKPLAADPISAVYYPINWAARLLPFPLGYNASAAFHHLWAAAGMFALLRFRRLSPLSAAFGALLFAFGGVLVSFDNMINALQSAAWAPWTLLAFDSWCARPRVAALAATAVGLTMTLLGAMPEVFFFENALFVAVAVDRRRTHGGPRLGRAVAAGLGASILAIGLGAVQLVPTAEFVLHSSRVTGLRADAVMRLALEPLGVLAVLVPRHFVDPSGSFHETAALWEGALTAAPWAVTLYLGPVLACAAAAGGMLTRFQRRWWIGVGALFLLLALGPAVPGYAWLVERVLPLRAVRYPEKFLLVVHGLLAVAAALGVESALRERRRFRVIAGAAAGLGVAALAGSLLLAVRPIFPYDLLSRDLAVAASGGALVAALAALGVRRARLAVLALLAIAAVDLYRVNAQVLPTVAWSDLLRPPSSARAMRRADDPLRIYSDAVGGPIVPPFPDGFVQEQNLLFWEVANYYGIANVNAPSNINLRDHERLGQLIEQVSPERVAPLLAAFNTAYVTSGKDLRRYPGLVPVLRPATAVEAHVYAVDGVVPRAFVPRTLLAVSDADAAIAHLRRGAAPAEVVAVEDTVAGELPPVMTGEVRLVRYRPQLVELAASMQTDGVVVLSDTFYPGWAATVDGVPVPILRANHFARAVRVPRGEHQVVFRYQPASVRIGAAVSIVTGVALLIAVIAARRR